MKRTVLCLALMLSFNIGAAEFGDKTFMELISAAKLSALKDLNSMIPICDHQELNCDNKAALVYFDTYGHQMPPMMVGMSIRLTRVLYQELMRIESKAIALNKNGRKIKAYDLAGDVGRGRWDSDPDNYTNGRYYAAEVRENVVKLYQYSKDIAGSKVAKTELMGFPYAN